MNGPFGIGAVQLRLVPTGRLHAGPPVVRDHQGAASAKVFEGAGVGSDPIPQVPRPGGFGIGVATGAEHRYKNVCLANLAGGRIGYRHSLAGMIDKSLLASTVFLAHHDVELARPLPIPIAVPTVVVPLGMGFPVFLPQQLQGHALAALQFLVGEVEVRQRPALGCHRWRRKHAVLQRSFVQIGGQWP